MKEQVINENYDYKEIGLNGFDYKLFEEEEGWKKQVGLDRYPYLKHLIQLWIGYCLRQMGKTNEAVCMKNSFTLNVGGKWPVKPFKRQEFWKCTGCTFSCLNISARWWGFRGLHTLQI